MNATPSSASTAKEKEFTRRDFLTLAWKSLLGISGLLGLGGLWEFLSFQPDPAPKTIFDLGPAAGYLPGTRTLIQEAQAVLIAREGSKPGAVAYQAFSLVCPHLGCEVGLKGEAYECPCHGSRFKADGSLERGPAEKPLTALTLQINEQGNLILDITQT